MHVTCRLTAFTIKTLEYANEADWILTLWIPGGLINKIAIWLCEQQNKTTGAFFDNGPIYDAKYRVSSKLSSLDDWPQFLPDKLSDCYWALREYSFITIKGGQGFGVRM